MAAEADATRIRLSDHTYDGVSRLPPAASDAATGPGDGVDVWAATVPATQAMPSDKPDPRAQWDDVGGAWILWDVERNEWRTIEGAGG